ncbi:MAG: Crp/Fnr family transcriptional regulator [Bacillota bacterium]
MNRHDLEFLRRIPLFLELDDNALIILAGLIYTRRYRRNMFVFTEGEPGEAVFLVRSGRVKITKTSTDGREQILHVMGPGDVFGEAVLFDGGPYPATAEVIQCGEIAFLRNSDLEDAVRANPELAIRLIRLLNRRLKTAQNRIRDLALKDTFTRTASLLTQLAEANGLVPEAGVEVEVDLSRQDLGAMIGTSRETVTRALSELKRMKVIDLTPNGFVILDPKRLTSLT